MLRGCPRLDLFTRHHFPLTTAKPSQPRQSDGHKNDEACREQIVLHPVKHRPEVERLERSPSTKKGERNQDIKRQPKHNCSPEGTQHNPADSTESLPPW